MNDERQISSAYEVQNRKLFNSPASLIEGGRGEGGGRRTRHLTATRTKNMPITLVSEFQSQYYILYPGS